MWVERDTMCIFLWCMEVRRKIPSCDVFLRRKYRSVKSIVTHPSPSHRHVSIVRCCVGVTQWSIHCIRWRKTVKQTSRGINEVDGSRWGHRVQRGKFGQPVCPVASSIAGYAGCHLPVNPLYEFLLSSPLCCEGRGQNWIGNSALCTLWDVVQIGSML